MVKETLTQLPPELVLHVAQHFPLSSLVNLLDTCQYLRQVLVEPQLWQNLDLTECVLQKDIQRCIYALRNVIFPRSKPTSIRRFKIRIETCLNIEVILNCCLLLKQSSHLVELDLEGYWGAVICCGDILEFCSNLKILRVAHAQGSISDGLLVRIGRFAKNLEKIVLEENRACHMITDVGTSLFFCHCGVNLKEVTLRGIVPISSSSLIQISKACPRLTRLDVSGCSEIGSIGVACILDNCIWLESINLTNCRHISDIAFEDLGKPISPALIPHLDKLTIRPPRFIGEYLKEIIVRSCYLITDLTALRFKTLPNLKFVDFSYCERLTIESFSLYARDEAKTTGIFTGCHIFD
ncbi:hypothetical protein BKA69DRAFT_1068713 [Paraphysoderma sedebokerense]|nr:hypothetical protein BKA69DRAFT_1068713 [Paraphysoderma sedebokerense]